MNEISLCTRILGGSAKEMHYFRFIDTISLRKCHMTADMIANIYIHRCQ